VAPAEGLGILESVTTGRPLAWDRGASIMPTTFQEFLRQKAEGTSSRDRIRHRDEWLGALNRLFDLIRNFLREADPDDLLEIVPYEVQRVEDRLGVYDAPAMKIRLGTDAVDLLPVGRFSIGHLSVHTLRRFQEENGVGETPAGRVDITDGERKYLLLRSMQGDQDRWFAVDEYSRAALLDRKHLEAILQDLLS
jgi:hypothetical protein